VKKLIVALAAVTVVAGMSLSAMPTFAQGSESASSSSSSSKHHHHHKKSKKSESSSSSSSG
jgi:hypothetical protein